MSMNIKNRVSLSIDEAVELLTKIADSLEMKGEFAFELKDQEVSIQAGTQLDAFLSLSPDEFSIVFKWGDQLQSTDTSQEEEWHPPVDEDTAETAPSPVTQAPQQEAVVMDLTPRRALPDRMALNTTTLPLDAGYWAPAFTSGNETEWTPVEIRSDLENKKWASEDQITTLADLTPASAKPKKSGSKPVSDDDLFSELDNLDKKSKPKSSVMAAEGLEKVEIPNRATAQPAGSVTSIPKPTQRSSASSSPRASIPTPSQASSSREETSSSSDQWVKPSEVLKKPQKTKETRKKASAMNIPSPKADHGTSKKSTIPVPKATATQEPGKVMDAEVREWKEPSREDNVTDDDWIRPSEFLKRSKKEDQENDNAINRPPPKAPDAEEEKKKKKGWASWD